MPKKTLEATVASGNHVIVQVKENQEELLADCQFTRHKMEPDDQFIAPLEKGHGRIEQRSVFVFKDFFTTNEDWRHVKEMVAVDRIRRLFVTQDKKWVEEHETSFYISTLSLSAPEYMYGIRAHWGTENKNHHVKDVTLSEDGSRIRKNPGNFAKLRSYALGVLRINKIKNVSTALYENVLNISTPLNYSGVL